MIDNGEYGIVVVGLGQTDDKVHSYLLKGERCWIGRDSIHRWTSAVGGDFILLARRAPSNVFHDPCSHVWPPVVVLSLGDGFVSSWMPGDKSLVHDPHYFSLDSEVRGNC